MVTVKTTEGVESVIKGKDPEDFMKGLVSQGEKKVSKNVWCNIICFYT